jgi:hypothetical protein
LHVATWITAVMFAGCGALVVRLQPLFEPTAVALWSVVTATGTCAGVLTWIATTRRWAALPIALTVSAAVLLTSIQFVLLPGRRPEAVEQIAALVRTHRNGVERIAPYRVFGRNLVFYTGIRNDEIFDDAQARAFLASPDRVLMVVRQADLTRLLVGLADSPRTIGQVDYVNTANIRLRTLVTPDPATVRETVLLISNR